MLRRIFELKLLANDLRFVGLFQTQYEDRLVKKRLRRGIDITH
jgi:hypothetical protein